MKFNELDLLMMMNADDINYSNLSEDMLRNLALGDELYIANYALAELSRRESQEASAVAWQILSKSLGDCYLQAASLKILFYINREQALDYIGKQAQHCNPYTLNSIMELMIENESEFQSGHALSVVPIVSERLQKLEDSAEFPDLEVRNSFLKLYGYGQNTQRLNAITPG
ncbi:hypothetical protein [Scytonema hofmannii]|nr:hypothetical protein [Scytonema hofmannii]